MMKKKIVLILLSLMAVCAAQAQFRYGVLVGANFSDLSFKQELAPTKMAIGPKAGLQCEMMFPGIGIGLEFGLIYSQVGAKQDLGSREVWASQGYGNERVYIHNIQIPLHLRLKYTRLNGLEDIIAPLIYGGPDFNIAVAHGKCEAYEYPGGDFGLTAGLGCELFKRWQLTASYTWGMSYSVKTKLLDNYSAKSNMWSVNLSYFF